jgi:hypothetical protein
MSAFPESNPITGYKSEDHNFYSNNRDRNNRQQRNGKRQPRHDLERQLSDKHLKRRTQIIQKERNNSDKMNRRFLYQQDQHTITSRISTTSLHDLNQQYQYDWQNRRPDHGGFFSVQNKTRSVFVLLLLLLLLLLIVQLALPTIWQPTTIKNMPWIMMGGNKNNNNQNDNNWGSDGEKDNNNNNDKNRSYQDLADSIKRLRIRRQVLLEETIEEWGEGKDERQIITNDDKIDRNNVDHDDLTNDHDNDNDNEIVTDDIIENIRLKRLEQKIQMEQNRKVRQEFASSKEKNNDIEIDSHDNDTSLKDKAISESIAALKLLNENKNKKGD